VVMFAWYVAYGIRYIVYGILYIVYQTWAASRASMRMIIILVWETQHMNANESHSRHAVVDAGANASRSH
jgi:hypothetical protein